MPEILVHGIKPVEQTYIASCSCGTTASFKESEATIWEYNNTGPKIVATPHFDCPVCDGPVSGRIDAPVIQGYFREIPIMSFDLMKKVNRAINEGVSTDSIYAMIEGAQS